MDSPMLACKSCVGEIVINDGVCMDTTWSHTVCQVSASAVVWQGSTSCQSWPFEGRRRSASLALSDISNLRMPTSNSNQPKHIAWHQPLCASQFSRFKGYAADGHRVPHCKAERCTGAEHINAESVLRAPVRLRLLVLLQEKLLTRLHSPQGFGASPHTVVTPGQSIALTTL